jgi:hypothetical protein
VAAAALLKYMWASPASLLGAMLALALLPFGARAALHSGVVEVTLLQAPRGARRPSLPFVAITLGHVVVAASPQDQAGLRAHERVHVAQFERWGALFLLAYPAESVRQFLLGRRPYLDNRFEVEARGRSGDARPIAPPPQPAGSR